MFQMRVPLALVLALGLLAMGCAPTAPSPTAAPAAKPTEASKPAAPAAPAPQPAASPSRSDATGSAAAPAAAPAPPAAPAASPAAKASAFDEKAVADFYRGKTIRIVVGFSPGGGFDTYSRLLARYLGKYLPGEPNVVVENREGAGSLTAANQVFKTEAKDGTVIGNFNEQLILQQALSAPGIEFDARKFQWLGSLVNSPSACAARTDAGINSIQEVINGKEWIVGVEAPGTTTYDVPALLKGVLGANIKLVPGYAGTSKLRLALESKETDGLCFTWDSLQSTGRALFESSPPQIKVLVMMGNQVPEHPWLKDVPAVETLAKTPEQKQLLAAANAPAEMSKPYSVAPEVPRDRVEALRQAFNQVAADKEFMAEAQKASLTVTPLTGPEVEQRVNQLLGTSPELLNRLKELLK